MSDHQQFPDKDADVSYASVEKPDSVNGAAVPQLKWSPLPMLAQGKIIKSFTPLDKFPSLKLSAFYKNLYYGDEVFLFETNNENWARGYLIVQPLPSDFIAKQADLDKLPELTINVVIVPLSHVHIIHRLPMTSNFAPPSQSDFDYHVTNHSIPSIHELQLSNSKARNGDLIDESANIRLKPPLPLVRLDSGDLLDEMIPSLSQLASHIFSMYSVAEYSLFEKLYKLFDELNDIRIKLHQSLVTNNERAQAKKQISLLFANISKLLSSKGIDSFRASNNTAKLKSDPSGFESISARDIHSGELYNAWDADLKKQPIPKLIAANQLSAALAPNFPVTNNLEEDLKPQKVPKFDRVIPSQILVDFKDVSGTSKLNPQGFAGMTAYLYLRSAKKRLTEAFAIHIKSNDFSLDKISAALFRNIPGTEIDNGRIYLVVIITEEIIVGSSKFSSSINKIRKGLAAGVTDISRIFSRHRGHLATGEAHQFTIKLFGSYVNKTDNTILDPKNMNFGWGELIDRIIAGSNKGVAVNPRAEKVVVSIKEFRDDLANVANDFDANLKTPIYQIRTNFFDPLVKPYDRIYLSLGKVNLFNNSSPFPGDLASIQLINDNPKSKIAISKATNEIPGNTWNFTSVRSNEVIGETIKISNIEKIGDNETLTLKLFVNYELRGSAQLIISSKGEIYEYQKNKLLNLGTEKGPEASVEVTTIYIGKTYNIENSFQHILNWRRLYSLPEHEDRLVETLKSLNQTSLQQSIKMFKELLNELLKIFDASINLSLPKLKNASFYSFIHLLDVVIARQEQYTYLFYDYVDELQRIIDSQNDSIPFVGADLLFVTATYFGKADTEWKFVGRTLCRILPVLVKISIIILNKDDLKEYKSSWKALAQTFVSFLKLNVDSMIPDQVLVLQYTDLVLEHLREVFDDHEIVDYAVSLISAVDKRGLSNNASMTQAANQASILNSKEAKIFITKLLLVRRLLNGFIFSNEKIPEYTHKFFFHSINWAIEAYDGGSGTTDLDCLRLANSVLISTCNLSWNVIIEKKEALAALPRDISRLLLKISKLFVRTHQYARNNSLFDAKRTYTQLFPNQHPFPELIIDSIINDVSVVEILVELGVIYSFITKISKNIASYSQGFISIIEDSANDIMTNSSSNFVKEFTKEDLYSIIQTNRLLIQGKFFPSEKWISLYALFIESVTTASELIKFILIRDHIPSAAHSEEFDRSLWSRYLKSILATAGSMPASICHLAEVPRKTAWKITNDVRGRCANILSQAWDCLGWDSLKRDFIRFQVRRNSGYHAEFIQEDYGILEELGIFCLQRNALCQIVGVKILWTIMVAELLVQETSEEPVSNKLLEVERGILVGLDKFFKSGRYIPGLYEQKGFIKRLKMVVRLDPEDESFADVYNFIQSLSEFLDVENGLCSVPRGEEFDDERTFHQLDILRQLMRVNNSKKFNASLDDLYEINLKKGNHVQAALCLELMASTYDWSVEEQLPISIKPKFPSQSSFERKESLYKQIAAELIQGNKIEKAVSIYKELADVYDRINFDLKGLGFVHEKLSDLYIRLNSLDRETPTYYKVSFIGIGFPKTVRSRSFIYEGLPFEHINSIHNRLLRLHTGAKIIGDDEAAVAIKNPPPGKYLHIITVKPQTDFTQNYGNLSSAARLYMQNKDLRFFTTSRRLQKSTSVLNLWVEETTYETNNSFPTMMNRSEVANVKIVRLSPIQNALRTLSTKTNDLVNAESSAQKAINSNYLNSSSFNELSRNLSGTVDSPVNGGIGQYKEFLATEPDPEDEEALGEHALLRNAFDNLTICIYRCLIVHGKLVPQSLRDSHLAMLKLFEKNFAIEIQRTGLNLQELEDALPSGTSSPSLSKVPSISTINTTTNISSSTNNSSRVSSASIAPTLSRVDTRSSESSSRVSITTNTTSATSGSGGKRRFLLNWRQSKAVNE